jgi:hypothetical protein
MAPSTAAQASKRQPWPAGSTSTIAGDHIAALAAKRP